LEGIMPITNETDLDRILREDLAVVFKHSPT
jgi:hypothetical protein